MLSVLSRVRCFKLLRKWMADDDLVPMDELVSYYEVASRICNLKEVQWLLSNLLSQIAKPSRVIYGVAVSLYCSDCIKVVPLITFVVQQTMLYGNVGLRLRNRSAANSICVTPPTYQTIRIGFFPPVFSKASEPKLVPVYTGFFCVAGKSSGGYC